MKFDFASFIDNVRLAVSNLITATVNLFESFMPKLWNKEAFAKACQQHRDDIWIEEKGRVYATSHTQQDVEETAQQMLAGWRKAAWQNLLSAFIDLLKTVDINELTFTVQRKKFQFN